MGTAETLARLPSYLRYHELAELVRVDVRTVKRWAARGIIARVRVGRRALIPREEVERLLTRKNEA